MDRPYHNAHLHHTLKLLRTGVWCWGLGLLPFSLPAQDRMVKAGFGGGYIGLTELNGSVHSLWRAEGGLHFSRFSMQAFVEGVFIPFSWPTGASPDSYGFLTGGVAGQYRQSVLNGFHAHAGLVTGYGLWYHRTPDSLPPDRPDRDGGLMLGPIAGLDLQLGRWGELCFNVQYRWFTGSGITGLPPPSELSSFQFALGLRLGIFRRDF